MGCLSPSLAPTGEESQQRGGVLCRGWYVGFNTVGAPFGSRISKRFGTACMPWHPRGSNQHQPDNGGFRFQARSTWPLPPRAMGKAPEDGCLAQLQSLESVPTLPPMPCSLIHKSLGSNTFWKMSCLWVKVENMALVEKCCMKLYEKLGLIGGGESVRLQESMEDFDTPGNTIFKHINFRTLIWDPIHWTVWEQTISQGILSLGEFQSAEE